MIGSRFELIKVYVNGPIVISNEQIQELSAVSPVIKEILDINGPEVFNPVKDIDCTPRGWFNIDIDDALLSLKPILMEEAFEVTFLSYCVTEIDRIDNFAFRSEGRIGTFVSHHASSVKYAILRSWHCTRQGATVAVLLTALVSFHPKIIKVYKYVNVFKLENAEVYPPFCVNGNPIHPPMCVWSLLTHLPRNNMFTGNSASTSQAWDLSLSDGSPRLSLFTPLQLCTWSAKKIGCSLRKNLSECSKSRKISA